ncbi:MAG: 2-C-methyl-D-erythritol 2,4-cyclodiphosphate synthase [Firmicutes bacterium]|nr:2-C-methyl-D-erythritol 2,4-cyclodiphosphate synthase [Bacillota bacterium]
MFRIGQGYDLHRLVPGRPLVLGGVTVPFTHGLFGHSDADVLVHAIIDALHGAAGRGDIGRHFPDDDPAYAGADSLVLLARTLASIRPPWEVLNVDATVIAERPRLSPFLPQMAAKIAGVLGLPPTAVNIKAKTNEGVDAIGRGEAMAALAVVLLAKEGQFTPGAPE